ncbi:glucose 1-dehydrogenase [Burkholderia sp. WAC0059]|uniref:SDR family NAD(P)-dependent oxidoreductase n=1 Tax=Burkholderia sp. WAC0059 TaxID=2066022 RepID=UPI000C7F311F|nr:SDR family NAD(P)-dependent oxidoreductase [Burkholderia sp. WAC0059]PLZ01862.1 glucose 1-dehydrogenase [Burkholderia sp. WAC0059]
MKMQPTAVVVGVGSEEGLGAAVARRFAKGGFHVIVGGRTAKKIEQVASSLGDSNGTPVQVDATKEEDVLHLFHAASTPGTGRSPASVVIFNAGNNQHIPFRELSGAQFEDFWRIGCFAGFLVGREAVNLLLPQGAGTIIFTGASASLRGRPGFAHFSAAKAGLRMLSQSMAREFGPQGLHVAHVVIDGGINGTRLKALRPEIVDERGTDGLLNIDAIAETYWQLHLQHPTAWTHEIDLRPFKESF